jgi:5-methylcytosine-specific restriction endonuclease McrA
MKFNRPCSGCGVLVRDSRCSACARLQQARNPRRRHNKYDYEWQKMSRLARSLQPWCSKCGATKDLTADHILSIAQGGLNTLDNISVLCRKCNSSKG